MYLIKLSRYSKESPDFLPFLRSQLPQIQKEFMELPSVVWEGILQVHPDLWIRMIEQYKVVKGEANWTNFCTRLSKVSPEKQEKCITTIENWGEHMDIKIVFRLLHCSRINI